MRFRIHPLFGALVLLLIFAFVLIGILVKPQILPALRERIPSLQTSVISNQDYAFYDPFGKPYPITVERGFGTKLAISGWVQEESFFKDKWITVAVPSETNPGGYWVKAYLPDGVDQIGLLKLEKGKFDKTQMWKTLRLESDPDTVKPGRQIILHFKTSEEETNKIINDFQNTQGQKQIELHSLNKMVVGIFE